MFIIFKCSSPPELVLCRQTFRGSTWWQATVPLSPKLNSVVPLTCLLCISDSMIGLTDFYSENNTQKAWLSQYLKVFEVRMRRQKSRLNVLRTWKPPVQHVGKFKVPCISWLRRGLLSKEVGSKTVVSLESSWLWWLHHVPQASAAGEWTIRQWCPGCFHTCWLLSGLHVDSF